MSNTDPTQGDKDTVTILLVGDEGCGKSTFLSRLKSGPLRPSPGQTKIATNQIDFLRDSDQPFIYDIRFSRKSFTLKAYDTACPDQHWSTLRPDMVVLTFDISNRETISGLRAVRSQPYPDAWADGFGYSDLWQWRNDITRYFQYGYGEKIPVLMLGLKRDLRVVNESIIYPQETYRIAQELFCDRYAECSSVTGELLAETFEDISRMAAMTTTAKGAQTSNEGCVVC